MMPKTLSDVRGYGAIDEMHNSENDPPPPFSRTPLYRLTLVVWISCFMFGAFAFFQYVVPGWMGNWGRWDSTDLGLYREKNSLANYLMVMHISFGIFLMVAGPIQLIPWIRQRWIRSHRWIGRVYIVSALVASSFSTVFVLMFRTSRRWIHEDIGNILFGFGAFVAAVQSYRFIRLKDIEQHKLWSFRLFLVIFGAPFARMQMVPYGIAVLFIPSYNGSTWIMNTFFYTIYIPAWVVLESIWRRMWIPNKLWIDGIAAYCLFILTAIFFNVWLPAIFNLPNAQGDVLQVNGTTTEL